MQLLKYKWVLLSISGILVAASVFGLIAFGLNRGIDFTGGTLWHIAFEDEVVIDQVSLTKLLVDAGLTDAVVTPQEGTKAFLIRTKEIGEARHQELLSKIQTQFGAAQELSFQSIGSVVGQELVRRAILALILNIIAIALYIAYAFRKVSQPVSSWKYAFITMLTLFHDAIIPIGLFAFLGHYLGLEIDTNFIVALLVVIGFSVHDTIVVFDRIRENVRISNVAKEGFEPLVNRSISETFARSVNTSLTLIVVLVTLFLLGAATLKYFILAILVGTVVGTYSSIFVASPLLVLWNRKK